MATTVVNQPSSQPTNKLTASVLAAAMMPALGLVLQNIAPQWYDASVIAGMTPVAVYLFGYFIKDEPNIVATVTESPA